jgi:hypothetical protein
LDPQTTPLGSIPAGRIAYTAPREEPDSGAPAQRNSAGSTTAASSKNTAASHPRVKGGGAHVRDLSSSPTSDLVAEKPKASRTSHSDRALGHDTPAFTLSIGDRCLFDHVATFRNIDHQGGVIERATRPPMQECRGRLEQLPADTHDICASTQWNPVEIHGSRRARYTAFGFELGRVTVHYPS